MVDPDFETEPDELEPEPLAADPDDPEEPEFPDEPLVAPLEEPLVNPELDDPDPVGLVLIDPDELPLLAPDPPLVAGAELEVPVELFGVVLGVAAEVLLVPFELVAGAVAPLAENPAAAVEFIPTT